jgi:DNA/RNA-binding domain of Phe-tRNA-synthetase-like protein
MDAEAAGPGLDWEPSPEQGWVAPHIAAEFPGLGLAWVEVEGRPARSPEPVLRRLRDLSDRFYGSHAIHMRERPIPWAYRVFFRQIGLDPDRTRTPVEQLALDRLHDGAFASRGMPADALTIATVETGVALRAFDAAKVDGRLCIRDSAPGESLPGKPGELAQGTLTIADGRAPLELLFGASPTGKSLEPGASRVAVVAVQVKGVPQAAVDEALWIACAAIEA